MDSDGLAQQMAVFRDAKVVIGLNSFFREPLLIAELRKVATDFSAPKSSLPFIQEAMERE